MERLGGTFVTSRLNHLSEAEANCPGDPVDADADVEDAGDAAASNTAAVVVINCAGLGNAAEHDRLERDPACYPIRGQVVRCKAPSLDGVYLAELGGGEFSCYAIQRGDFAVLGGTHEAGTSTTRVHSFIRLT